MCGRGTGPTGIDEADRQQRQEVEAGRGPLRILAPSRVEHLHQRRAVWGGSDRSERSRSSTVVVFFVSRGAGRWWSAPESPVRKQSDSAHPEVLPDVADSCCSSGLSSVARVTPA